MASLRLTRFIALLLCASAALAADETLESQMKRILDVYAVA